MLDSESLLASDMTQSLLLHQRFLMAGSYPVGVLTQHCPSRASAKTCPIWHGPAYLPVDQSVMANPEVQVFEDEFPLVRSCPELDELRIARELTDLTIQATSLATCVLVFGESTVADQCAVYQCDLEANTCEELSIMEGLQGARFLTHGVLSNIDAAAGI
ncbi:unnamed protein product [Dibothriocephalus latus]|uniref:Uncharacterized protein n=1 Tax=Dibothriocephalus latus TaxID=60516 RepID=A0A3P7PKW2_DIBLA|nr:unnamed protein product [Dibothriocephalus latus]